MPAVEGPIYNIKKSYSVQSLVIIDHYSPTSFHHERPVRGSMVVAGGPMHDHTGVPVCQIISGDRIPKATGWPDKIRLSYPLMASLKRAANRVEFSADSAPSFLRGGFSISSYRLQPVITKTSTRQKRGVLLFIQAQFERRVCVPKMRIKLSDNSSHDGQQWMRIT